MYKLGTSIWKQNTVGGGGLSKPEFREEVIRGKGFIVVKEAKCPLCGTKMHEDEDETVWQCQNEECPVLWVQIVDKKYGNPITSEEL